MVTDVLFALAIFFLILMLLTDYTEVVLALTLLAVIWQFVEFFGASLFLATFLLVTASLAYLVVYLAFGGRERDPRRPSLLPNLIDALLMRDRSDDDRRNDGQNRGRLDKGVNTIEDDRR